MANGNDTRRLAVILAADIVGYSRLMEADESGTLAQLRTHRKELIDPKIDEYGGRIVKTTGDGMLVEFASAADAVQHAVDVQRAMAQRNASVPADKRIVFRIGINLGDIIVEGEDILGEGVNIAARLEESCEPGGVRISGKVHAEVAGKLDLAFEDLGDQTAKNLEAPVRTYRVVLEGGAAVAAPSVAKSPARARSPWLVPAAVAAVAVIAVIAVAAWQTTRDDDIQTATTSEDAAEQPAALALPDKPSIAVLAFDNLSGDADQEYFSDAISEAIITALAQVPNLFVIARNSSFHYKGTATNVTQVARELAVRWVLEGSVQRQGDRVRVIAQLIDGPADAHLWQKTFDREETDIFALQDDITRLVVTEIANEVRYTTHTEGTRNVEAWDLMIRAKMLFLDGTVAGNAESIATALKAIELDPEYARAYAILAWARNFNRQLGLSDGRENTRQIVEGLARKSVELDETDYYTRWTLASMLQGQAKFDEADVEFQKAIALNPNEPDILALMSWGQNFQGHPAKAVQMMLDAMRGNPFHPPWYASFLALYYYGAKDYENAIGRSKEVAEFLPAFFAPHAVMAASYAQLGQQKEAEAHAALAVQKNPKFLIANFPPGVDVMDETGRNHWAEGLRKAGLTAGPQATN